MEGQQSRFIRVEVACGRTKGRAFVLQDQSIQVMIRGGRGFGTLVEKNRYDKIE